MTRTKISLAETVNDAPIAINDTLTGALEDTAYTFNTNELTQNDNDPEGHSFSVTDVTTADGTVQLNTDADGSPDGTITFTPTNDFYGQANIEYTVTDELGKSSTKEIQKNRENQENASIQMGKYHLNNPVNRGWVNTNKYEIIKSDGNVLSGNSF